MDQVDDVEALPPQPQELAEEQRPRFSRRKKVVVAAVSVAIVAAIGIGAALGTRKPQTTSESAGAVGSNEGEQSGIALDEEPSQEVGSDIAWAEPTDESGNASEVSEASEQAGEQSEGALGDGSFDIIMDVGHSLEYPEDLIYDAGFERPELESSETLNAATSSVHATPAEEKVEITFDNNDVALIGMDDFEGPVSDFIVSDLVRTSIATSSTCKNANEGLWKMDLSTDLYPWETFWQLTDSQGLTIAAGPPEGRNYARSTRYVGQLCLPAGQYKLLFGDKNGDGNCCQYGQGLMTVRVNGNIVAETDDSPFSSVEYGIKVTPLTGGPNRPPTRRPTSKPTPTPTLKPTPLPTRKPNPAPALDPAGFQKCVDVVVKTDNWGFETGYQFRQVEDNGGLGPVLLEKNQGQMEKNQSYRDTVCVDDGTYRLTVIDPFQGIQGAGYFAVEVDGEQVMHGAQFSNPEKRISYDILVGNEPEITPGEKKWLDEHNRLRKEYHEKNGKEFRPLVWNEELAESSSKWVDELLKTCKISREPGLILGENMSARTAGGPRDEGAEAILYRWTKKEDKGYPLNQSMTQVYWYSTRQVGCSEKFVDYDTGIRCYASICRYARAGNCGVGQYESWKEATLADRTPCGPVCMGDECY